MCVRRVKLSIAFLVAACVPAASYPDCIKTYYATHASACLTEIADGLRVGRYDGEPTIIGFIAERLVSDRSLYHTFALTNPPPPSRTLLTEALLFAGMYDEALAIAPNAEIDRIAGLHKVVKRPLITYIYPFDDLQLNDYLIGAYMASGNKAYIDNITLNYKDIDATMMHDVLRFGMILTRYWTMTTPGGRAPAKALMDASRSRYGAGPGPHGTGRVLALATAYWVLQKYGAQDAGISEELNVFRRTNSNFVQAETQERAALESYVKVDLGLGQSKYNLFINSALALYEQLAPIKETDQAFIDAMSEIK